MAGADIKVDGNFPGGNVVVERVEADTVYLREDARDTEGNWFYWHFRVRSAGRRRWQFLFTSWEVVGTRGPAVSRDGGGTWCYLGAEPDAAGRSFHYTFGGGEPDTRFCFTIPYLEADLERWRRRHAKSPHLVCERLCLSGEGRDVPVLRMGKLAGHPRYRVAVTARHHACETMASFALEGLMDAVLDPGTAGEWLRTHAEFAVFPFVDRDGVEDGDQGKNRRPRDHWLDYAGQSVHAETRAIRDMLPGWSRGALRAAVDLHCPWIRGPRNEVIFQVGDRAGHVWAEQRRFGRLLAGAQSGPLPYDPADDLPFGVDWNREREYVKGQGFAAFASGLPGVVLATTIEIPYANVGEETMTPEHARGFGRGLAAALRGFLESMVPGPPPGADRPGWRGPLRPRRNGKQITDGHAD